MTIRIQMPAGREFRFPGFIVNMTMVALLVLLISLGNWQSDRAAVKQAFIDNFSQGNLDKAQPLSDAIANGADGYTRVHVQGKFEQNGPALYLDNRTHEGVLGFMVYWPFKMHESEERVLVNLGWIAAGPTRKQVPEVSVPHAEVSISGLLYRPTQGAFRLGPDDPPLSMSKWIIQTLELDDLSARLGYGLQSAALLLAADEGFGLLRQWKPQYATSPAKHHAYAFQWYALAVALMIIYLFANLGARPSTDAQEEGNTNHE